MKRPHSFHVKLSELELGRLHKLAEAAGTTGAAVIRSLMRGAASQQCCHPVNGWGHEMSCPNFATSKRTR